MSLVKANQLMRTGEYTKAIQQYEELKNSLPEVLSKLLNFNIDLCNKKIKSTGGLFIDVRVFDRDFYLSQNPDVKKAGVDPESHYWSSGEKEGRWPNAGFDPAFYLKVNADVRVAGMSPFKHFQSSGYKEGRLAASPLATPDSAQFLNKKPLLFVGHDGIHAGAEVVLLEIVRWFATHTTRKIKILLLEPGPLADKYTHYGELYVLPKKEVDRPEELKKFLEEGFEFVYLNTVVCGRLIKYAQDLNLEINSPVISHIHEMEKVLETFAEELSYLKKTTHHWISASPATTQTLIELHGVNETSITTVPAFINPVAKEHSNNNDLKLKARTELNIPADAFVVMGCGTVYWRKGADLFVETAKQVNKESDKKVYFLWLGNGPDRKKLEGVLSAKEKEFIIFLGHKANANSLLAAADVFYLSSREDPFPLVVLESAQHAIPSICFGPATGITAFIEKDAGLILDEVEPGQATNAICQLMDNPRLLKNLGNTAKFKFFKTYTTEKQCLALFQTLKDKTDYKPSVSVIVPFYNHEKFVDERLNSIFNQEIKDIEIIVLDDCSSDNTSQKVESYLADKRISFIKNNINSGSPFKQWEKGIALAKSDIVWIAEGDDSCDSNFLSTLLPYFNDSMTNIASTRTEIIDEAGNLQENALMPYLEMAAPGKFNASYFLDGFVEVEQQLGAMCTLVNASGLLIRKSSLNESLKEAQSWKMCGDWLIYLEALRGGKIAYDVKTRNLFRRHSASQVNKIEGTPIYFQERYKITEYVVNNFSVTESLLSKAFAAIDHEWDRFKYKNPDKKLKDFYNKELLANKIKLKNPTAHIAFYVHGMTFSKGGIERLAAQLANHFVEAGFQITIYCRVHKNKKSIYPIYESVIIKQIFDENNLEKSTHNLADALRDDKVNLFIPMLSEWLFEPVVDAGVRAGVKIIASEHNDPWKIEELWWSKESRIACFEKVDAIHLLLEKYLESLPAHLQQKAKVIPNGVEIPKQVNSNVNRDKVILSVGRLAEQKRHDRLIEAVALIKNELRTSGHQVHIYGEGHLKDNLVKLINELGVEDIVKLKGKTDNINEIYKKSDFFVLSSEFEGLPLTLLEAMSFGLPVIAFKNCNGPNEIIRYNIDGYLVEDVKVFSDKIKHFLGGVEPHFRQSAHERAGCYSEERFFKGWVDMICNFTNSKYLNA